ncbi:MAG: glycerol-3-phosphate ABC transporter ATP-binding protein [Phycisphaerae bacterium]|nr:glycerol-3-phosphate ABC transporter ATP-binding protein [Phycisphaerae bacterium]
MASVTLESIGKIYPGGVRAVEGVDLHIADGEFVVLVGPSGCGKSTTLRMVAGLEDISEGTLRIGDRVVNEVAARDRDVAMVFQNYALYPHLDVRRNLSFGLERRRRKLGLSRADIAGRVEKTATSLGIDSLLDRFPRQLSGGQRQRVAVGRALVRDPAVFLLDEPLSNLDARLRVETRAELRVLHRRLEATMLYVTHDQEEAMSLGDRLVVMHEGHVQQVGSPMDVYRCPVNRFVASFVGSPAMNMLEGGIVDGDRGPVFKVSSGGEITLPPIEHRGPAVLGLRPESIGFEPEATGRGPLVEIDAVERYGDRGDAWLRLVDGGGQERLVHRGSAVDLPAEGLRVRLGALEEGIHVFESGSNGRRLGPEPL